MDWLKFVILLFFLVFTFNFVSAWELNGTVYDINGTALNNSVINVTIRDQNFQVVGYNWTFSNRTGWFNLTVANSPTWFYEPGVKHFQNNATGGSTPIDFIGQIVPSFPYAMLQDGLSTDFYLREAGTINITAVNSTGAVKTFQYIVKDQTLGYPIAQQFNSYVSSALIYVPRDRNYSIMIFPNQSMPVSFNWNNFSAVSSYNISTPSNSVNLSRYNVTNHTLHKQFNATENLIWVSGFTKNTTGQSLVWDEFTVIPLILEPGNMIFLGSGGMPYNMSAWRSPNFSDNFSLSTGFYNMTLPGPAESANYILFATARNGTNYYGGYRNISLNFSSTDTQVNFTMYPLMSTDWNSSNSNITMNNALNWNQVNISTAKQGFNLVNSTGLLSQLSSHIEITVNYSNYNATEFTFMLDTSQAGSASFYIPLINSTGIKEMNVYSQTYSPKRLGTRTPAEILANNNITLSAFTPADIDGASLGANLKIALFKSNSTCDVPNPGSACVIGSSDTGGEAFGSFNPLESIIGGGKLSFRMGLLSSGIIVHYVNVDMLASGPPDALFDDSASETTTGDFNSAMRFGSLGPTIYDYVLISMPYTEGSSSTTGLNENVQINMSLPLLYDENSSGVMDWSRPVWNVTVNGTNGTFLGANYSHFDARKSEWQTLMGNNTCTTNVSIFNATNPCYLDTTNNRIWIRLPHFSGNKPSVTGSVVTATAATTATSAGGSGGIATTQVVKKINTWDKITQGTVAIMKDFDSDIGIKQIQIEVNNEVQNVKVTVTKYDVKPANVTKEKTGKIYKYLQVETENLSESLKKATVTIQVEKNWTSENGVEKENVSMSKFDNTTKEWKDLTTTYSSEDNNFYYYNVELTSFSYFAISEKSSVSGEETTSGATTSGATTASEKRNLIWLWILIGVVVVVSIVWFAVKRRNIS